MRPGGGSPTGGNGVATITEKDPPHGDDHAQRRTRTRFVRRRVRQRRQRGRRRHDGRGRGGNDRGRRRGHHRRCGSRASGRRQARDGHRGRQRQPVDAGQGGLRHLVPPDDPVRVRPAHAARHRRVGRALPRRVDRAERRLHGVDHQGTRGGHVPRRHPVRRRRDRRQPHPPHEVVPHRRRRSPTSPRTRRHAADRDRPHDGRDHDDSAVGAVPVLPRRPDRLHGLARRGSPRPTRTCRSKPKPVGTGPFVFKDYKPGESFTATKNPTTGTSRTLPRRASSSGSIPDVLHRVRARSKPATSTSSTRRTARPSRSTARIPRTSR